VSRQVVELRDRLLGLLCKRWQAEGEAHDDKADKDSKPE
jgi:hypothetical protein